MKEIALNNNDFQDVSKISKYHSNFVHILPKVINNQQRC